MLANAKVLVTGPAGQIAFPLAAHLAQTNDVWGIARFTDAPARARVEAVGVRTVACDLATGDFAGLPDDFDYVLHLATFRNGGLDYDQALRVNAEGTHLLLAHCRAAKAALVMSTVLRGRPALRLCPINPTTNVDEITETIARLTRFSLAAADRTRALYRPARDHGASGERLDV